MIYSESGKFSIGEDFILPQRSLLRHDIVDSLKELSESMANAVYDYIVLASMGEARHSHSHTKAYIQEIPGGASRSAIYGAGPQYNPDQVLPLLIDVFDRPWGGAFGGPKWAKIAESALMYGNTSNILFLDHCADLQHNTGTVFNKTSTSEVTGFSLNCNVMPILEWKLHGNVLEPPKTMTMQGKGYYRPTIRVVDLMSRYYIAWHNQKIPLTIIKNAVASDWKYQPVIWGTKTMTLVGDKKNKSGSIDPNPENFSQSLKDTYEQYNSVV